MDQERISDYNHKIANWVAKQGLFFQLLHTTRLFGKSANGSQHFVQLGIRLFVVLIIAFAVFLFLLSGWHKKSGFSENIGQRIQQSLAAETVDCSQISGSLFGDSTISELNLTGGKKSFFDMLSLQNIQFNPGLLPILKDTFDLGSVRSSKLDLELRISSTDRANTAQMFSPFFANQSWLKFDTLETTNGNVRWGYSEKTRGAISNSELILVRRENGWKATFKQGRLSYRWIKDAELVEFVALISPGAFEIESCVVKKDGADVSLNGALETLGSGPKLKGSGSLKNAALKTFLPSNYKDLLSGILNTDFSFSGVIDSAEGLDFQFKPAKDIQKTVLPNTITFSSKIPLIRAMNTLDSTRKYSNYEFNENTWHVILQKDQVEVKDVQLSSSNDDHIKLALNLKIRTEKQEAEPEIEELESDNVQPSFSVETSEEESIFMQTDYAKNLLFSKSYLSEQYSGNGQLSLSDRSFPGRESIQKTYPVTENGRRILEFDLEGILSELTKEFSQSLYELAQ